MKYLFMSILAFLLLHSKASKAQHVVSTKEHRIVMQLVSGDTAIYRMTIRQIGNLKKAAPNAKIEVVCHSTGIYLLVSEKTAYQKEIEELSQQGVIWAACENTMRERKIPKEKLISVCTTVPSGVFEVVLKQEEGWSYLKVGY